jgi:hypothetical protein
MDSQLGMLRYSIKALKKMPGRKSIFFISSRPYLQAMMVSSGSADIETIADEALRAGIVIHTLNIGGIAGRNLDAGLSTWQYRTINTGLTPVTSVSKSLSLYDSLESGFEINQLYSNANAAAKLPSLSSRTGGITLSDNFFVTPSGIGRANELLKGYYLISYTPPEDSFTARNSQAGSGIYHRIRIKSKRRGSEVFTRDGFIGGSTPLKAHSIVDDVSLPEAVSSPFQYKDLAVDLYSGYAYVPSSGYFLRSWVHVAGNPIGYIDEKDGSHSISLELMLLTSDSYGNINDYKLLQYDYHLKDADIPWFRENGLDFEAYLPIKKPGTFSVRAAIRDRSSGKIGSAYQFQDIPDLMKHKLALSSLFILNHVEDAAEIQSGNSSTKDALKQILDWKAEPRSPAVRSYHPGESFNYLTIAYNAKMKDDSGSNLESRFVLLKDGKEYSTEDFRAVDFINNPGMAGIPIAKKLVLGKNLEVGEYVLQIEVRNMQTGKKYDFTSQALGFDILKEVVAEKYTPRTESLMSEGEGQEPR